KRWQETRDPRYKSTLNKLNREVQKWLRSIQNENWNKTLKDANIEDQTLYKILKRQDKESNIIPPLLGPAGFVHDSRGKAELIATSLENQFQLNQESLNKNMTTM
ncbi:hypothetical protein NPIL_644241, partial [Nephila pilipes]